MTRDEKAEAAAAGLVGRHLELGLIDSFLDRAAVEGAALLFTGTDALVAP